MSNGYCKLIESVDPRGLDAFSWHGRFLRPGDLIDERDLNPPGYPAQPLLLEFAPAEGAASGWRRHQAGDEWILWAWRARTGQWEKLGSTTATGSEWANVLRPIALAHLEPPPAVWRRTLTEARQRITAAIDAEIDAVEPLYRPALLSIVHDLCARRACSLPDPAENSEGRSVGKNVPTDLHSTIVDFSLLSLPYMQARLPQWSGAVSPSGVGDSFSDSPSGLGELDAKGSAISDANPENSLANRNALSIESDSVPKTTTKPPSMAERKSAAALLGGIGGRKASQNLTAEQRTQRARIAAAARWAKTPPPSEEAVSA